MPTIKPTDFVFQAAISITAAIVSRRDFNVQVHAQQIAERNTETIDIAISLAKKLDIEADKIPVTPMP